MPYLGILRECLVGVKLCPGNLGDRCKSVNFIDFIFFRDLSARISFIDCMDDFRKEQSPSLDNNGKVDSFLGSL